MCLLTVVNKCWFNSSDSVLKHCSRSMTNKFFSCWFFRSAVTEHGRLLQKTVAKNVPITTCFHGMLYRLYVYVQVMCKISASFMLLKGTVFSVCLPVCLLCCLLPGSTFANIAGFDPGTGHV